MRGGMTGVISQALRQETTAPLMAMWAGVGLNIRGTLQTAMKRWLQGGWKIREEPQKTAPLMQRSLKMLSISLLASSTQLHRCLSHILPPEAVAIVH
jgi:hypothetical protein